MGKRGKPPWRPGGSAEQPADDAPEDASSSAAQPADSAPEGSAEQPVHPSPDDTSKLHGSFAYLAFAAQDYTRREARQQALESFREAMQSGLDVIHMVFSREDDLLNVRDDIDKEIWKTSEASSVAQPAYQLEKNLLSVWSEKFGQRVPDDTDPDLTGEVPTICLTFDTAVGRIWSTNVSWPNLGLPRTTRTRLLQKYSKQAHHAGSVIHTIGGELGNAVMFENLVQSVDPSYSVAAHEPVCVMANSSDEWISFRGFQTNFAIAQAVVVQVWHDSDAHPVEAKPASRKRMLGTSQAKPASRKRSRQVARHC